MRTSPLEVMRDATIVAVNAAWVWFATYNGCPGGLRTGLGHNYLDSIDSDAAIDGSTARAAIDGVRSVLSGHVDSFSLEYPLHCPQRDRWFVMLAVPFGTQGVVVAHVDVTADHRPLHDPMSPTRHRGSPTESRRDRCALRRHR